MSSIGPFEDGPTHANEIAKEEDHAGHPPRFIDGECTFANISDRLNSPRKTKINDLLFLWIESPLQSSNLL